MITEALRASTLGRNLIRQPQSNDLGAVTSCQISIWSTLRGLLRDEMVDDNIRNLNQLNQEQWRNSISDPQTLMFVYQDDEGRIVGLARGRMEMGKLSHLGFIGVVPEGRRKGTGQTLLASFIEESTRRGSHKISLFTAPSLKAAIALYVRNGFVQEASLSSHWYKQDFLIYSKFLR